MSMLARAALLAIVIAAARPASAEGQASPADSLRRRIEFLERRSLELERRVSDLESLVNTGSSRAQKAFAPASSSTLQKWRQLKSGMNPDEVRALLGEPQRVNGGTVAFWFYPDNASVTFMSDELMNWTEPRSFRSED